MPEALIISDASPIISLYEIGHLDLVKKIYYRVVITDIIKREIRIDLPDWIEVSSDYDQQQYELLCLEIDAGEASAIALALKHPGSRLILDERKGRQVAKRLNLQVTGTIGIIVKAKEEGIIGSGKEILDKLEKHGFWLSEKLRQQILKRMKEA